MTTTASFRPDLSVIMVTPGRYSTCRKTISYLCAQTVRDRIELVIVAPSLAGLEADESELASFGGRQVVEVGDVVSSGDAMAAGIRAARAPVVVYAEEHSYPEPDWAEILIDEHRGSHAAVGCAMDNANPGAVSWASLFGQFGPVVVPARSGVATFLGGHHASYNRDVLLQYGDLLGQLMSNECALHIDLRRRGYQLYLSGEAVSHHVNISRARTYFSLELMGQRGFAAARAKAGEWSVLRRAVYVAASPLIPLIRLRRIVHDVRRTGRGRELLPRILPIVVPALWCGAVGEALGYVAGAGSPAKRTEIELDRYAYVRDRDRRSTQAG
jgi:hypothetical protein